MTIQKTFDLALKQSKNGDRDSFYSSDKVHPNKYYAYYTKEQWDKFLSEMELTIRKAYEKGGGKELEEKLYRGTWIPPKMASYASSSRFIYELLHESKAIFEQKLPTPIYRSTSNMDAFFIDRNLFIEAKCHEIYASPNPKYKVAYKEFYNMFSSEKTFSYTPHSDKNDSAIDFYYNGKLIEKFDIKQTISHILGIANACKIGVKINGKWEALNLERGITFAYLVYDPSELEGYLDTNHWKEIKSCYESEEKWIKEHINFLKNIFRNSLEYVGYNESEASSLTEIFKVEFRNQSNINELII